MLFRSLVDGSFVGGVAVTVVSGNSISGKPVGSHRLSVWSITERNRKRGWVLPLGELNSEPSRSGYAGYARVRTRSLEIRVTTNMGRAPTHANIPRGTQKSN